MRAEISEIWGLRLQDDPAAALDRARVVFERPSQDEDMYDMFWGCWYEHFAGSRCLLLDFARATHADPESYGQGLDRLEEWADLCESTLGQFHVQRLKARIGLLRTIRLDDLGIEALAEALREAALACARDFVAPGDADGKHATGTEEATGSEEPTGSGVVFGRESNQMAGRLPENDSRPLPPENDSRPLPAFLRRLEPRDKWLDVFGRLGQQLGWHNPGLLMVGQMLAHVYGKDDPTPDDQDVFKTWVLLAGTKAKSPMGVLAQLRLRRLSGGCGGFFPDPYAAGYLRLKDDFKGGLVRAWNAALGGRTLDFDVAWSLELIDVDFGTRSLPIEGRSAEAAVCCALRGLAEGQRLEQCVAITAELDDQGSAGIWLSPVGGIDEKTLAKPLVPKRITEIVVSDQQPEILRNNGGEVKIANGQIRLVPATLVDDAYRRLVRWERITSHVRERMAADARGLIEKLCGAYVVPSLSQPVPRQATEESHKPLSKDEVADLLNGRLQPRDRILLLAHSGLGKSVLLVECQQRMAQRPNGPLPVRLVGLSKFPWSDPEQARRRMADALAEFLPRQVSEDDRWKWFERLVDSGQAVFLLDALDQTIVDKLDGLSSFLAANLGDCPVLMTGRPYVTETRAAVLNVDTLRREGDERQWSEMRLDKFDESQQREFLGQWADHVLVTREEAEVSWAHEESIARKQQWADLVGQPLLLKMLRDLAADSKLKEITNRHSVYQKAVEQLMEKGWQALMQSESKRVFHSTTRVEQALRHIAWNRARPGDFQGVVSSEELDEVIASVTQQLPNAAEYDVRNALDQMNIVTCGGIVESEQKDRLAWRHLSFCEYFAGLELARGYPRHRMMPPAGGERFERQAANEFAAAVQKNARSQDWNGLLRYALSQLAVSSKAEDQERLAALAADLIQFGNPFVVTQAIREDGVRLPDALDRLARWLVHRDLRTANAWTKDDRKPQVDAEMLALLDSAFVLGRRDSRYLHAAWELVAESDLELAQSIRARFLGEFPKLLASADPTAVAIRDGFREIPPVDDPLRQTMRFAVGVAEGEKTDPYFDFIRRRYIALSAPLEIAITPVTNAQFELFAPEHEHRRTQYSVSPDCPAVELTWFEAELYCVWLGDLGGGGPCRLPTEIEWEIAARAGSEGPYCRIREPDGTLRDVTTEDELRRVAHFDSSGGTSPVAAGREPNAWGLCDMLGNVWEWCADWDIRDWFRVSRGGSWNDWPVLVRVTCRNWDASEPRSNALGFRPARSSVGSGPVQSGTG